MTKFALDRSVDGGSRYQANEFSVDLFQGFKRTMSWSPYLDGPVGLFYSDDELLRDFIERLVEKSDETKDSWVHVFDMEADREFSESDRLQVYPRTEVSLGDVVTEIFEACSEMAKACYSSGFLTPPNRRLDIILITVSPKVLKSLTPAIARRLIETIASSSRFRVPIIFASREANALYKPVIEKLDWVAYLGERNEQFGTDFHKLDAGFYNTGRVKTGIQYSKGREYMAVLQSLEYEPSQWRSLNVMQRDAERKIYAKFLEELDDGTD